MLMLWGIKISKDDLDQYMDTILEHNPLLPKKKRRGILRIVSKYKELQCEILNKVN